MHFVVHRISLLVMLAAFTTADKWSKCTVLDTENKYHVCWRTILNKGSNHTKDSDEIEFRVEVEAHGYVGFGLSKKGRMPGSDIVTGWIKDGNAHFQDRFSKSNDMPEVDRLQNWNLVEGHENDTHTSLIFRRKLDTCDDQDIIIDENDIQLIYAYSDKDPSEENKLKYHHKKRGQKYVNLLGSDAHHQKIDKSNLSYWDVLMPNVSITSNSTSEMWCKVYRSPVLTKKNHIVMAEPNIQEGHETYIHHIVIYECVETLDAEFEPLVDHPGQICKGITFPGAMVKCEKGILFWSIGHPDIVLPKNVGIALEPGPSKYFMLQIHYNNPSRDAGITDNSGYRVYYTSHLREKEAGLLILGSVLEPTTFIPPGVEKYTLAAHSSRECLDSEIPDDGLKMIGVQLHAHSLARHLKVRHFRNNTELAPLDENAFYDFKYEDFTYFSREVPFFKGDQYTLECTYNSTVRKNVTLGGMTAEDEMCLAIILYYPKIKRYFTWSTPTFKKVSEELKANITYSSNINEGIAQFGSYISNLNWTNVNITEIEHETRFSDQDADCPDNNRELSKLKQTVNYPRKFKPYKRPQNCTSN